MYENVKNKSLRYYLMLLEYENLLKCDLSIFKTKIKKKKNKRTLGNKVIGTKRITKRKVKIRKK